MCNAGLAKQLHTWLDEEWAPLDAHPRLAEAAAAAYVRSRDRGQHEMGDVLLSMCSDLMEPLHSSDFFDSFTNAFEVRRLDGSAGAGLAQRARSTPCCATGAAPGAATRQVGNKATEILMLRNGCDVCCTSDDDKARVARVDQLVLETLGGAPPAPGALAPTDLPRQS